MKSVFVLVVFAALMLVPTGCVVGPLPPSENLTDPQQSSGLSADGRQRMQTMRDLEYIKAEEEQKHPAYDSEDWKSRK